jgi:hypothetical protein
MTKKIPLLVLASIFATACGGSGSGSSDSTPEAPQPDENQAAISVSEKFDEICGEVEPENFTELTLLEPYEVFAGSTTSSRASVFIASNNIATCIEGDLDSLIIAGQGSRVVVNGSVSKIDIKGESYHRIYVYGDVDSAEVRGSYTEIYAHSFATYDDHGIENAFKHVRDITE